MWWVATPLGMNSSDCVFQPDSALLTRVLETGQMIQVAKMMRTASLARKETRFGVYHCRTDYPETSVEYEGQILLWRTEQGMRTAFRKLDYTLLP